MEPSLSDPLMYMLIFFLVGLFVCATGMISATAVTLKDEISDRCMIIKREEGGHPEIKRDSHDTVVIGGFGIAAAVFAALAVVCLFVYGDPLSPRRDFYALLLAAAAVSFLIVGGIELSRVRDPRARCGDDIDNIPLPWVEIASTLVSGLTIVGLATPLVEKYINH